MYELEVIETITYSKFDNIAEIKRKGADIKGKLFTGDKIKVKSKEEAEYLCGANPKNVVACRIISEPKTEDIAEKVDKVNEKIGKKEKQPRKKKAKTTSVDEN